MAIRGESDHNVCIMKHLSQLASGNKEAGKPMIWCLANEKENFNRSHEKSVKSINFSEMNFSFESITRWKRQLLSN